MSLYFDHAATKTPDKELLDIYAEKSKLFAKNPSSTYKGGVEAKNIIHEARERICRALDAEGEDLIFTSGATESINTALHSIVLTSQQRQRPLCSFAGEHPASRETLVFLSQVQQRKLCFIPLKEGLPDLTLLEEVLPKEKPDLLSSLLVSNTTGAIYPVDDLVYLRNKYVRTAKIHLDAVQALGKIPLSFKELGVDYLSLSLHKIGCLKGSGLLIKKKNAPFVPLLHGGGQQGNMRSGTENPAMAHTAAVAIEKIIAEAGKTNEHVSLLKTSFLSYLQNRSFPFRLLSPANAVPHILSIYVPSLRAQNIQTALNQFAVEVGIGSACSSAKSKADEQILALGLTDEEALHVLRISFALENSKDDVIFLAEKLIHVCKLFGVQ